MVCAALTRVDASFPANNFDGSRTRKCASVHKTRALASALSKRARARAHVCQTYAPLSRARAKNPLKRDIHSAAMVTIESFC